jgi:hypothetical protein
MKIVRTSLYSLHFAGHRNTEPINTRSFTSTPHSPSWNSSKTKWKFYLSFYMHIKFHWCIGDLSQQVFFLYIRIHTITYCHVYGRLTYKTGFGLDDWIYCTLYIHNSGLQVMQYTIAILHTFQFTVTHALGFSVFTSRILETVFSQSHSNFNSHMKSSFRSLIHFFPLFYSCQFRRLDWIQFLYSQAHILAGWRLETRLFTSDYCPILCHVFWLCTFITLQHEPHRKHSLYC